MIITRENLEKTLTAKDFKDIFDHLFTIYREIEKMQLIIKLQRQEIEILKYKNSHSGRSMIIIKGNKICMLNLGKN